MTKKQIKKYLNYQSFLTDINYNWWNEQIIMTISEIEFIERLDLLNKKQKNRLEFLHNRMNYLMKKTNFERKSIKQLNKKMKRYQEVYQ